MSSDTYLPKGGRKQRWRASGAIAKTALASSEYRANFLWPHDPDSVEEAGYEFANARTEDYRKIWWRILISRLANQPPKRKRAL